LVSHLKENACEMVWSQDAKEFIISMDGEFARRTKNENR